MAVVRSKRLYLRDEKRKSKNNSRTVRRQMRQEMNMYQLDC